MISLKSFVFLLAVIYIDAFYVGTPSISSPIRVPFNESITLNCKYTVNDGNGEFIGWYKDNELITNEKKGNYEVKISPTETVFRIKKFGHGQEENVQRWYVETGKTGSETPVECDFKRIEPLPSPLAMKTDRADETIRSSHGAVRRNLGESLRLICHILPERRSIDSSNTVTWKYGLHHEIDSNLAEHMVVNDNEIFIKSLKKSDRGNYQCSLNNVTFSVLVRIKDQYAALWPFVGIVAAVSVFVVIILIIEKRNKANKKSIPIDGNAQDQTETLLASGLNKETSDDNKKRIAQA